MSGLVDNLRGTLAGVLDASQHLAWFVDWQSGNRRCARPSHLAIADPHTQLHDPR